MVTIMVLAPTALYALSRPQLRDLVPSEIRQVPRWIGLTSMFVALLSALLVAGHSEIASVIVAQTTSTAISGSLMATATQIPATAAQAVNLDGVGLGASGALVGSPVLVAAQSVVDPAVMFPRAFLYAASAMFGAAMGFAFLSNMVGRMQPQARLIPNWFMRETRPQSQGNAFGNFTMFVLAVFQLVNVLMAVLRRLLRLIGWLLVLLLLGVPFLAYWVARGVSMLNAWSARRAERFAGWVRLKQGGEPWPAEREGKFLRSLMDAVHHTDVLPRFLAFLFHALVAALVLAGLASVSLVVAPAVLRWLGIGRFIVEGISWIAHNSVLAWGQVSDPQGPWMQFLLEVLTAPNGEALWVAFLLGSLGFLVVFVTNFPEGENRNVDRRFSSRVVSDEVD